MMFRTKPYLMGALWSFLGASININGAAAAGPSGLAGRAQTVSAETLWPGGRGQYFEWYQYFGLHRFDGGGTVDLTFSITPFAPRGRGATLVGLDTEGGATFVSLNFQDGLVNRTLSYDPAGWNTVGVTLDFTSQSYRLKVNGGEAGSFPFLVPAQSVQAFRVDYSDSDLESAIGWLDSVRVSSADQIFLNVDFDQDLPGAQSLSGNSKLAPARPGETSSEESTPNAPPSSDVLTILSGPESQRAAVGQTAVFRINATGVQPLKYQWRFNGTPIGGANDSALKLDKVGPEQEGTYDVTVTDAGGASVKSATTVLMLNQSGGTVVFVNRIPNRIDAPVFAEDGATRLAGEKFLAQLYAGPEGGTLAPVGPAVPFRTGAAAGYWFPTLDAVRAIPSVPPGQTAFVQVRAWETGSGSTFEQTLASGGPVGASGILRIKTGGDGAPPSVPANLEGLGSFKLTRNPGPELRGLGIPPGTVNIPEPGVVLGLRFSGDAIQLSILGQSGDTYEIHKSGDLIHWEPAVRLSSTDAQLLFEEGAGGSLHQFYRVVVLPRVSR